MFIIDLYSIKGNKFSIVVRFSTCSFSCLPFLFVLEKLKIVKGGKRTCCYHRYKLWGWQLGKWSFSLATLFYYKYQYFNHFLIYSLEYFLFYISFINGFWFIHSHCIILISLLLLDVDCPCRNQNAFYPQS
jgi:hypothetical protein